MDPNLDSKQRYVELKKRMKHLLHENESYKQEIAKVNERLLNVSKDKAFLLEQLLQFEDNDSSTESELSDSDQDRKPPEPPKKRPRQRKPKPQPATPQASNSWSHSSKGHNRTTTSVGAISSSNQGNHSGHGHSKTSKGGGHTKRRSKQDNQARNPHSTGHQASVQQQPQHMNSATARISTVETPMGNHFTQQAKSSASTSIRNTLTAEEVERHLQAKGGSRIQMPQPTPLTLPAELFNEDAFITDLSSERGNL